MPSDHASASPVAAQNSAPDELYGRPDRRREDFRLIRGQGRYVGDLCAGDAAHIVFVRSPQASARVTAIDTAAARAMPGVLAVLTAAELAEDGLSAFSIPVKMQKPKGEGTASETPRPWLVGDRVRYLGEPVAMVVAASAAMARDAAEAVEVDYDVTPAVASTIEARAPGAPPVWDELSGNLACRWAQGDEAGVERALLAADHVVKLESRTSRVAAMPIEPRGALGYVEGKRTVLCVSHQHPVDLCNNIAAIFGIDKADIRVFAGDVGGSFGMKSGVSREEVLVFWAARRLRRRVCWIADRSEAFLCDEHARDVTIEARLGLDKNARFTALSVRYHFNIGAYFSGRSVSPITNFGGISGVYRTPLVFGEAIGVVSNTQPTAAYRGAGRPDATFAIERIIDLAAQELNLDPFELRRRNLIQPKEMPYQTPFVFNYDSGNFPKCMARAAELADYRGYKARLREARRRGRLRGIGIANPIEMAAGPFTNPGRDYARVTMDANGGVCVIVGAMSVGQGLETVLTELVSRRLGIPLDDVRYVQGDSDLVPRGKGSGGSSGLTLGGGAVTLSVDALIEKGKALASDMLEASASDIELTGGRFHIKGTDRSVSLDEVVRNAAKAGSGLEGTHDFQIKQPTYPNGCHICEVEIDPDTGAAQIIRYVCVEDVGKVMNPLLAEGQIHGGVVQGAGQALLELIVHESGSAQLQTGSFMDYGMPRAGDSPPISSDFVEVPTALNPLGVKGIGEAGTVGAISATMNAVCNALQPLGVTHLDMPATSFRIWQAIQDAQGR